MVPTDEERNRLMFEYRAGDVFSPKIAPKEALANLVADFASSVEKGTEPTSSGRFGADAVKVLEAAQKSIEAGGTEITLTWN